MKTRKDAYLQMLRVRNYSPGTLKSLAMFLRLFFAHLQTSGVDDLRAVEPEESTSRPGAFGAYVKAVDELIRLTCFVRELQGLLLSGSQPLGDWSRLCRGSHGPHH